MRSDPRHRNRMLQAAALLATACSAREAPAPAATPPPTLAETGLYSDLPARSLAPGVLGYTPVYPLWSDGATKRRFIRLPPGAAIDARDPDAWVFPVGTRVWKEFAFGGRPVETRYLERTPAGWLYATYACADTGLGRWTEREFLDTMRSGRHLGRGRSLLPPMPVQAIGQMTDEDLRAVFAYLRSVPPIRNRVPEPLPPPVAAR